MNINDTQDDDADKKLDVFVYCPYENIFERFSPTKFVSVIGDDFFHAKIFQSILIWLDFNSTIIVQTGGSPATRIQSS